jgi:protein involved in polysaccharide export with SLBB domain
MKKSIKFLLLIFFIGIYSFASAQDISQLKKVDIETLTDAQVSSYWEAAKSKGYTLDQIEVIAKYQGVSSLKIAEFKRRIQELSTAQSKSLKKEDDLSDTNDSFGLKGNEVQKDSIVKKDLLFGFDFFNNPKITFTPNINLAVPDHYQLGSGDELVMDLWGATEVSYVGTINNQGALKIDGVGQVYVNGLTFEQAKRKIIARLKKKHSGIGAANSSYNKIYTNINITKVRTVQINIIGEVKVPGTYSLVSLSTVLNALYAAGGPTKEGTFREVKLVRKGETKAVFDIYNYLLTGSEKGNLTIQDQDVILVSPYRNLVTVEGAVKRPGKYELLKEEKLTDLVQYFGGFTSNAYTNLLVVERVNGKEKEIKEVRLADASSFVVKSGDRFMIKEVVDKFRNRVSVFGEVYRPGDFEFIKGMSLKDLIEKAEGITDEAFLSRGILIRSHDDTDKKNIAFSVSEILNGNKNIILKSKDEVRIFHKENLREKQTVRVEGAVNNPQEFEFVKNMQIEDMIALSGGLTEGADARVVNVSRRLKDGSFKTLSENFTISSKNNLEINKGEPFYLQPFDIVNVRYLKGYTIQKTVIVKGEVKFQGNYVISNKNERISDLIKRAGGLTQFAYVKGATLYRKMSAENDLKLLETLKTINEKDSISNSNSIEKKTFKIGIELDRILRRGGIASKYDLFLEEGDELLIPSEKQTIEVKGEVLSPSLVRFEKRKNLKDYISNSGGYSQRAKKNKIFVLYSNGEIKTIKNYFFFKIYPKIDPGSLIFVPKKVESTNKMSTQEVLGITSGIATLALIIQSLTK